MLPAFIDFVICVSKSVCLVDKNAVLDALSIEMLVKSQCLLRNPNFMIRILVKSQAELIPHSMDFAELCWFLIPQNAQESHGYWRQSWRWAA